MKTIISVSNFSFQNYHFASFDELQTQFSLLQDIRSMYKQAKISFSMGSDILKNTYFGLSVEDQIKNFACGRDKGVQTAFLIKFDREYRKGFNLGLTTDELKDKSLETPNEKDKENYVLFTLQDFRENYTKFKTEDEFLKHYEHILGHYPIDNESFYERAESHFTNLVYHQDCKSTLDRVSDGFCNYSIAFTECLKALNEFSPTDISSTKDKVYNINSLTAYDCTSEGKSDKNFKFDFHYNGSSFPALDCQYHLKPSKTNTVGDGSHNHKRLYFGFIPINNTTEWKIAIAAIGPHISIHNSDDRYAPQKTVRKKKTRKGNS